MKVRIFFALILFFLTGYRGGSFEYNEAAAQNNSPKLLPGEEIRYLVRYGFIKLGEIRLKVLSKKDINGKTIYSTIGYIDSYPGLPFVDLHQIYESKVNENFFSAYFKGTVRKEKYTTFTEYLFDYPKKTVKVKKGKVTPFEMWTDTSGVAETEYHDGLSIFYWARMNLGREHSIKVPCFVNEQKVSASVNFYTKPEIIEIDAVDYEIPCWRLDGYTDFVSVFGLTGHFEGWFSKDDACIPLVAKLNVIIGKITVELIEWKRDGWAPPKIKDKI